MKTKQIKKQSYKMYNVNFYDHPMLYKNYQKIKKNKDSANELIEYPVLKSLLIKQKNMRVLDLGCGSGDYALRLFKNAKHFDGVDSSELMLEEFEKKITSQKIGNFYLHHASIESFIYRKEHYDLVFSTLVFHHLKEVSQVFANIQRSLKKNGVFLFSVLHPLLMACRPLLSNHKNQTKNWQIIDYLVAGKRCYNWLDVDVQKYHHTFSNYIQALVENKFKILNIIEPNLPKKKLRTNPDLTQFHKNPVFLIICAQK